MHKFINNQIPSVHCSHTKFMLHAEDQIWLPGISVHYLTITKLYNFFKKQH